MIEPAALLNAAVPRAPADPLFAAVGSGADKGVGDYTPLDNVIFPTPHEIAD